MCVEMRSARMGQKGGRLTGANSEQGINMDGQEEFIPMRRLWMAVLLQAIEDFTARGQYWEKKINGVVLKGACLDRIAAQEKRRAHKWFRSEGKGCGTFLWVCDFLDLDAGWTWKSIRDMRRDQAASEHPDTQDKSFGWRQNPYFVSRPEGARIGRLKASGNGKEN